MKRYIVAIFASLILAASVNGQNPFPADTGKQQDTFGGVLFHEIEADTFAPEIVEESEPAQYVVVYQQPVVTTTYSSGAGYGFFGNSRRWWLGKALGFRSPGERRSMRRSARASRAASFGYGSSGSSAVYSYGSTGGSVTYRSTGPATSSVSTYRASWTWPGMSEGSLRSHGAGGPHWWPDAQTASYDELKRRHDACHNRIGPYSAAMIREANRTTPVRTTVIPLDSLPT